MSGSWILAGVVASMLLAGGQAFAQPPAPTRPAPSQPSGPITSPPAQLRPPGSPALGQPQGLPAKPKEPPSPLEGVADVRAAIESATQRAATRGVRVLVIFASGPQDEMTRLFVEMMGSSDMRRLLGMEFETVWAETGKSEKSAANREIAKTLGVEVKPGDEHAMLAVLDTNGKLLASKSAAGMIDEVRRRAYSVMKASDFLSAHKAAPPVAKDLLDAAVARAKESKRVVLVTFGEFGDEWSTRFVQWLAQPEVSKAMGSHVIVAPIEMLRDTGAADLLGALGGVRVQSLPWFVLVGPDGKPIVASQAEKTPNIGFPTDDVEIGVFLGMLKQAAPGLKDEESAAIRASLVEHRVGKK